MKQTHFEVSNNIYC